MAAEELLRRTRTLNQLGTSEASQRRSSEGASSVRWPGFLAVSDGLYLSAQGCPCLLSEPPLNSVVVAETPAISGEARSRRTRQSGMMEGPANIWPVHARPRLGPAYVGVSLGRSHLRSVASDISRTNRMAEATDFLKLHWNSLKAPKNHTAHRRGQNSYNEQLPTRPTRSFPTP